MGFEALERFSGPPFSGGSLLSGADQLVPKALDRGEGGAGLLRGDQVERGHGGGHQVGPGIEVVPSGARPLGLGRVVVLVAAEIQVVDVQVGVPAVHLEVAEAQRQCVLEGLERRLVERVVRRGRGVRPVGLRCAGVGGGGDGRQCAAYARLGEVLGTAVVFVASGVVACGRHGRVEDGTEAGWGDRGDRGA